ncbi:MAG: pitrilysin family protein [Candidatus Shapirobacteria bacterium]|nr:pitrilysin family protein [Candidatus Shapirobacteria bacterium]
MKINRQKLKNGSNLTIIDLPDSLSLTLLALSRSGPRFDPNKKEGLSHFVEHLILDGSGKFRDKNETARILEKEGIITGAFSYQETNSYWMRGMKDSWPLMVRVLTEQIQNPLFRDEDVKTEKEIVKDELRLLIDNPDSNIWEIWAENVWQGTPLGRSFIGDSNIMESFTRIDVVNHFKNNYLASDTELVVCGDVSGGDLTDLLNKNLVKFDRSSPRAILPVVVKREKPINVCYQDTEGMTVAYGFLTTRMADDDVIVLEVIENILAGGWGSLLRREIFQTGLTYSIECYNRNLSDTGYLMNLFTCDKNNLNKIIQLINNQLKLIKDGNLNQIEIDRAKGFLSGSLILNNEKSDDLANWFGYQKMFNSEKVLTPKEKCERVSKISNEAIVRVANKYFTDKNWYLSLIGQIEESEIKVGL